MLLSRSNEVEPVGADHRTGDDEPQQVGDLEFVQDEGRGEDDDQNEQKLQDRVLERQGEIYVCEQKHRADEFCQIYKDNKNRDTDKSRCRKSSGKTPSAGLPARFITSSV